MWNRKLKKCFSDELGCLEIDFTKFKCKKCRENHFIKLEGGFGKCRVCPPNCLDCNPFKGCLSCKEGYWLDPVTSNCVKCTSNCAQCDCQGKCNLCESKFELNNNGKKLYFIIYWFTLVNSLFVDNRINVKNVSKGAIGENQNTTRIIYRRST